MKATVTSKGQVTIPYSIRAKANIVAGSQLDFQLEEDGTLTVHLVILDISELKGIVKIKRKRSVTIAEMKQAITERSKEKVK